MTLRSGIVAGIYLTGVACASRAGDAGGQPAPSVPPTEPPDPTALASVVDTNPDPGVVEFDLEAREGTKTYGASPPTKVWTYNGTVPGPLVDAKVGDRVIVHFKNSLPEPTTIHWHGVRLPAQMDGSLAMQQPILPGATFIYAFTLKDAGLFWFHPHMRSDVQVHKGLYGTLRVRAAGEPDVDMERVLVLDDVGLKADGQLSEYLDDMSRMMGRQGNTLLVNGVANARLDVPARALVRLRFVNVANGRFFNLRLPGAKLRVIGTDGGFVPRPYDVDTLLMAPGERYDVVFVAPGEAGGEVPLLDEPYERGHASGRDPTLEVARLRLSAPPAPGPKAPPASFPDLERLPDGPVDFPIHFAEATVGGEDVFTINGAVSPDVPPITVTRGDVKVLGVQNDSDMDHPFHLHGFFFQILARDGVAAAPAALANKDTVIVRARSSLKLVARFDEPGTWMYHCHILEHAEHGMMGEIRVE